MKANREYGEAVDAFTTLNVGYSYADGTANTQSRSHNAANEITRIQSPEGDIAPRYDAAGNMVSVPATPGLSTKQYKATWDAWNRLVELGDGANGSKAVARYAYDGETRGRASLACGGPLRTLPLRSRLKLRPDRFQQKALSSHECFPESHLGIRFWQI